MCPEDNGPFSNRHGYAPRNHEITVREDAPREFREALVQIASRVGLSDSAIRDVICKVLLCLPKTGNLPDLIEAEVFRLIRECEWYSVYDIAESLYGHISQGADSGQAQEFERLLNDFFRVQGIGWQMVEGVIRTRGSESFEAAVQEASSVLEATGRNTASNEIHEAIGDLSRRPEPDITGAIQHAMAALECIARDICGDLSATLGQILSRHQDILKIPRPLNEAIEKAWGYASEMGRHLREGRIPSHEEAELIVGIAASVCIYLSKKFPRPA